jgi:Mce-associated membrane protein
MDVAAARTSGPVTLVPGRVIAVAALAVVAVTALVLAGMTVPRLAAADERDQRRTEVLEAARQHAVNFTTLDYRHLDRDLGRVLRGATGGFRTQFRKGAGDLTGLVTANRAVSEGEVLEAGLVSLDDDSARVLVVADSTVTNAAGSDPQRRHYRLQLDLARHGQRWLVSDLQFVG